ncbi:hypothetical protein [Rugamonas apoptosis]|uniref:Uncharacterized protein n=1 Tax=Rugamonas apoptosis TaxID=2758570 RepID=A0A7W2IJG1_9BURK|nr:hypothetical protein [Rugamonas apoptosis]MBA5686730.1 hypothetical protein [Rugamonas apoptosis]
MSNAPIGISLERLLASVRWLEQRSRAVGLPPVLARLPMRWLCWHYCRMLQTKIVRMRRISTKFRRWVVVVRQMAAIGAERLEMLDLDKGLTDAVESTRQSLWELRDCCLEIDTMFAQLGYVSARLQRRQQELLQAISDSCELAGVLQAELSAHDNAVLARLRDLRAQELAACGPLPGG